MTGFDFRIGAQVHFLDGRGGVLRKLVIDSYTHRVTDLVVERGFLQKHDRVVPISVVEAVTPEEIYVAIDSEQLLHYPEFREIEFAEPVDGWTRTHYPREHTLHWVPFGEAYESTEQSIPLTRKLSVEGIHWNQAAIGRGSRVRNLDGDLGRIDHLLVDGEDLEVTHLVVHKGLSPYYRVIPISWVEFIEENQVHIRGTTEQLGVLPSYRVHLEEDVLSRLRERLETARHDYSNVTASQEHNTLKLRGVVPTEHAKQEATEIALSIPGVIDVENLLETEITVATRVTEALDADPRTADSVIEVIYDRGIVTLSGEVESNEIHAAAEEIAEAQGGVISVVNALEVRYETTVADGSPEVAAAVWLKNYIP